MRFWATVALSHGNEDGQSTLEYLVVLLGFMAVVAALYTLVDAGYSGVFGRLAEQSASHAIGGTNAASGAADLFMY